MKIRGNTVGTTMPRANWNQEDPKKADYIKGRDAVNKAIADAKTAADNAQTTANNAKTAAGNAQTAADNHAADKNNPHGVTLAQIGAQAQHQNATITLAANAWVGNSQTVTLDGLDKDDTVFSTPAAACYEQYIEYGVRLFAQDNRMLIYTCEDTPTVDLTIDVTRLPVGGSGGSGGGAAEGAVLYTEQTLTKKQQEQARKNIGVDLDGKVDKIYLISVFEDLKTALEATDIEGAGAVLDEAILDLSTLA